MGRDLQGMRFAKHLHRNQRQACPTALYANRARQYVTGTARMALVLTVTLPLAAVLAATGLFVVVDLHERNGGRANGAGVFLFKWLRRREKRSVP